MLSGSSGLGSGLRAHPLVDVQGHRFDLEPWPLALADPFQPGFVAAQRLGQQLRFLFAQRALAGGLQQLGQAVDRSRIAAEAQHWRQVRVVVATDLGRLFNPALGLDGSRRLPARKRG